MSTATGGGDVRCTGRRGFGGGLVLMHAETSSNAKIAADLDRMSSSDANRPRVSLVTHRVPRHLIVQR